MKAAGMEIIKSVKSVVNVLHLNQITALAYAFGLGICFFIGLFIRGLFIYYVKYKAPNDRPINKMILYDQLVQFTIGSVYPIMLIFSMASQTALFAYFGDKGCFVFWISSMISSHAFIVGGFGMAVFRLLCILNRTGSFKKATLVNIIHLVGFALVCCTITLISAGVFIGGWERVPMYLVCKDFGTDISAVHHNLQNQNLGMFLRSLTIYILQSLFIFETLIYVKIYFFIWNHNKGMIITQMLSSDDMQQRNRKNVITLSGQVTSFIVEFLTSMIYLAQIFYHDLADPSHQPILLIFASTIISCVQLGSSHELKRFVKSLIEK